MNSRSIAPRRFGAAAAFGKFFVLIALLCLSVANAHALDFSVGAEQVIYTKAQRTKKGLDSWPDGSLGVVSNGNGTYSFYGANSSKPTWTTGTLTDPAQSKKTIAITGIPKNAFSYVSGGPVYQDAKSGERLMIYHAERPGKTATDFHSVLGIAVATSSMSTAFRDLGTIIEPNLQTGNTEVGGGSFMVMNGYLNVYYHDTDTSGATSELAVARAPLSDLLNNAWNGFATPFTKYFNGNWSQPGRGGLASALEIGNPSDSWPAVSYNDYLNQAVMITPQYESGGGDLYMSTSTDGINWAPRQPIALDAGEQFYPTIVGTGADPTHSGQSFYVYYTDSQKGGWNRWTDAALVRRQITLNPTPPPVVTPPMTPPPTVTTWQEISNYASNFQAGRPATGWQYDWDPTGKLGNSAKFSPLEWSDVAQAYNTTGDATQVPGKKTHVDDYLSLASTGGHPGQPGYFPIVGYTIQAGDGAGSYRIVDSSINKTDSIVSSGEDGMQILIYVNNKQLGAQQILTNGQLATFNYTLGQLNVGDTIWLMIDPLKNQLYDSFTNFDFTVQKSVQQTQSLVSRLSLAQSQAVPEPGTASLLLIGLAGLCFARKFAGRRQLV